MSGFSLRLWSLTPKMLYDALLYAGLYTVLPVCCQSQAPSDRPILRAIVSALTNAEGEIVSDVSP